MIVGLSGYARSGKDTVADILVSELGFIRVAFADKLREAVYALNPIVFMDLGWQSDPAYLQDVIDEFGWDGYKETAFGPEIRRLLQRMGTEVGRNVLGNNIWVDAAYKDIKYGKNYVITDCRFVNEAQSLRDVDGEVWRINRPGVGPVNDHISEVGLDEWPFDRIIDNDGSLEDLKDEVLRHARWL